MILLQAQQGNSPFKRQFSLRLAELPSTLERQKMSATSDQTSSSLLADDPVLAKLGLDEDPAAQQPPTLKSTPNSGTGSQTRQGQKYTVFPFTILCSISVMSLKNQLNQLYQISEAQQRAQHGRRDLSLGPIRALVNSPPPALQ